MKVLDLDGVRAFVRPLVGADQADLAERTEARLPGRPTPPRMLAWLLNLPEGPGAHEADLLAAGVPPRVVRRLRPLRSWPSWRPVDERAAEIRANGDEAVLRAWLAELPEGRARSELVAAVDVAAGTVPPLDRLVDALRAGFGDGPWWYAVTAIGLLRDADAVPELLRNFRAVDAWANRRRYDLQTGLLTALARVMTGVERTWRSPVPPDARWRPLLAELAAGEDPERLRTLATDLLVALGDPADDPLLVDLLAGPYTTSSAAAQALGERRAVAAVPGLIALLRHPGGVDDSRRDIAARALGRFAGLVDPAPVVAALGAELADQRGENWDIARALARFGGPEAARAAVAVGGGFAPWILGELGDRSAVPALLERPVTRVTLQALGKLRDPAALPLLVRTATGPSSWDRREAVWALGEIDPPAALPTLLLAVHDPDADVRLQAARALARCPVPDALPGLLAILRTGPGERFALEALLREPDRRALPVLLDQFWHTEDRRVRRLVASVLLATDPAGIVGHVGHALVPHNPPDVRRTCLWLAGRLGDRSLVRPATASLREGDELTRACAADALGRLGPDQDALKLLRAALADESPRLRVAAVKALGRWGPPGEAPGLAAARDDLHPTVRSAARALAPS